MPQIVPQIAAINAAKSFKRTHAKSFQRGQGMTEYIIIVALISVAAIGVYQYFGQVVRSQTAAIANEVGGVTGVDSIAVAKAAATAASNETGKKGLDAFAGAAAEKAASGK